MRPTDEQQKVLDKCVGNYVVVPSNHPHLEDITRMYLERGVGIMIDYTKDSLTTP